MGVLLVASGVKRNSPDIILLPFQVAFAVETVLLGLDFFRKGALVKKKNLFGL
jgi:hypothetical protein